MTSMPRVLIEFDAGRGVQAVPVQGLPFTIGSGVDDAVRIVHPSVAPGHAQVWSPAPGVVAIAPASGPVFHPNGQLTAPCQAHDGSWFAVGQVRIRVRVAAGAAQAVPENAYAARKALTKDNAQDDDAKPMPAGLKLFLALVVVAVAAGAAVPVYMLHKKLSAASQEAAKAASAEAPKVAELPKAQPVADGTDKKPDGMQAAGPDRMTPSPTTETFAPAVAEATDPSAQPESPVAPEVEASQPPAGKQGNAGGFGAASPSTCDEFTREVLATFDGALNAHKAFNAAAIAYAEGPTAETAERLLAAGTAANDAELLIVALTVPEVLDGCQPSFVLQERLQERLSAYEEELERVAAVRKRCGSPEWRIPMPLAPFEVNLNGEDRVIRDAVATEGFWGEGFPGGLTPQLMARFGPKLRAMIVRRGQLRPEDNLIFKFRCVRRAMDAQVAYAEGDALAWADAFRDSMRFLAEDDPIPYYLAKYAYSSHGDDSRPGWCRSNHWGNGAGRFWAGPDRVMQNAIDQLPILDRYNRREFGKSLADRTKDELQRDVLGWLLLESRRDEAWQRRVEREAPAEFRAIEPYIR